jgi:hypothetical protein
MDFKKPNSLAPFPEREGEQDFYFLFFLFFLSPLPYEGRGWGRGFLVKDINLYTFFWGKR